MAVLGLNLSITSMDHEFGALVLGDFPSALNGISLSIKSLCCPFCSRSTNGPSVLMRYNMLIAASAHEIGPIFSAWLKVRIVITTLLMSLYYTRYFLLPHIFYVVIN